MREPITHALIAPGCFTGPCESNFDVAMHKALTMPPGTEVVPLYRADDALIRELVAVLWSIQIDEDESRTTTKLLAGQALAKAKAAGF